MAKIKTPPTREEMIESAKKTCIEIPTTTRVRAWTFQAMKQNFVIVSYRNMIDKVDVYHSTRAGRKTSTTPIVSLNNSFDHERALHEALEILIPVQEETQTQQ
jgi:hypothetical protein